MYIKNTVEVKEEEKPAKLFEQKEFYTVEEAYMWKNSLKGKTIKIKGTVHKVARGIMKLDGVKVVSSI